MKKDINTLAKEIQKECEKDNEPITFEEALQMAKMELGEKEIKRYEQKAIEKTKKPRKPKEDKVKELLYMACRNGLEINVNIENFDVKPNKVSFDYDNCNYSLVITRHRNK